MINNELEARLQVVSLDAIKVLSEKTQLNKCKEELTELRASISLFQWERNEKNRIDAIQELADVYVTIHHAYNALVKDCFDEAIFTNKINSAIENVQNLINKKLQQ